MYLAYSTYCTRSKRKDVSILTLAFANGGPAAELDTAGSYMPTAAIPSRALASLLTYCWGR